MYLDMDHPDGDSVAAILRQRQEESPPPDITDIFARFDVPAAMEFVPLANDHQDLLEPEENYIGMAEDFLDAMLDNELNMSMDVQRMGTDDEQWIARTDRLRAPMTDSRWIMSTDGLRAPLPDSRWSADQDERNVLDDDDDEDEALEAMWSVDLLWANNLVQSASRNELAAVSRNELAAVSRNELAAASRNELAAAEPEEQLRVTVEPEEQLRVTVEPDSVVHVMIDDEARVNDDNGLRAKDDGGQQLMDADDYEHWTMFLQPVDVFVIVSFVLILFVLGVIYIFHWCTDLIEELLTDLP